MKLEFGPVIENGMRKVFTRTGGILLVVVLAYESSVIILEGIVETSLLTSQLPGDVGTVPSISSSVMTVFFLSTLVLSMLQLVVAARAFARPLDAHADFPPELYTRRIGRATLRMLVGVFVALVLVLVGTLFFVLPGLFLAASFFFVPFAIAVEDRGVLESLERSWGLARGHRLPIAILVLGIVAVFSLASYANATVIDFGANYQTALWVLTAAGVLVIAQSIAASAYVHVRDET